MNDARHPFPTCSPSIRSNTRSVRKASVRSWQERGSFSSQRIVLVAEDERRSSALPPAKRQIASAPVEWASVGRPTSEYARYCVCRPGRISVETVCASTTGGHVGDLAVEEAPREAPTPSEADSEASRPSSRDLLPRGRQLSRSRSDAAIAPVMSPYATPSCCAPDRARRTRPSMTTRPKSTSTTPAWLCWIEAMRARRRTQSKERASRSRSATPAIMIQGRGRRRLFTAGKRPAPRPHYLATRRRPSPGRPWISIEVRVPRDPPVEEAVDHPCPERFRRRGRRALRASEDRSRSLSSLRSAPL